MPKVKIIKAKDVTPEMRERMDRLKDAHLSGLESTDQDHTPVYIIGEMHRPITLAVNNWITEARDSIAERKETEKRQFGLQNCYTKA